MLDTCEVFVKWDLAAVPLKERVRHWHGENLGGKRCHDVEKFGRVQAATPAHPRELGAAVQAKG